MSTPIRTTVASKLRGKISSFGIQRNPFLWIALVVCLVGAGVILYYYYKFVYLPNQAADQASVVQTATARQGDLVISASGTGTLAAEEMELSFEAGGEVTKLLVKAGDRVEAGELLAEVDSTDAQIKYAEAKRNYQELTSAAAIASAQEAVAQAQADLDRAIYHLEYLISPDVLYWEMQIEEGEQTLKKAKARVEESPAEEDAQQTPEEAEAFLDFAQDKLKEAWELYDEEYVPETFPLVDEIGEKDIFAIPTDLEIRQARIAIGEARDQLEENKDLYNVLTGGPMPEDASSDALIELQQAERELQDAQAILDGTKIFAPISGMIMEVSTSVGDTVGTDTVIVLADLSQPYLEIYLDETDWDKIAVGNETEVTFDDLPDQVLTGRITKVDSELYTSFDSTAVRAEVSLDSTFAAIGLPIGASAAVDVISQRVEEAVLVPVEALHETSPGEYAVFVVEEGKPRLRVIEVGLQDELYAEVKSGLEPGEVVTTRTMETE
jgi:RND family efflux transporter MFP subunit